MEFVYEVGLLLLLCLWCVWFFEEVGVIEKYVVVLNLVKVGKGLMIFMCVWLKG